MIRVLIDRRLIGSVDEDFHHALMEARQEAMRNPGYISGETLHDLEDENHYIVISNWRSKADWDRWMASEGRLRVHNLISPMLAEDEKVSILASPGMKG